MRRLLNDQLMLPFMRTFSAFFRRFPLAVVVFSCGTISVLIALLFCRKDRLVARLQLSLAFPELRTSAKNSLWKNTKLWLKRERLVLGSFFHMGMTVGELHKWEDLLPDSPQAIVEDPLDPNRVQYGRVKIQGVAIARKIIEERRPCVTLSGHLGNFELLAAALSRYGGTITTIGRLPNYAWLATLLDELRTSYGVKVLWRSDAQVVRVISRDMHEGRVIAALIDQDTALPSEFIPFFGVVAAAPFGPVKLAIKAKAALMYSFVVRTGFLKHEIIMAPLPYNSEDPEAVRNSLSLFSQKLEELIRKYPEQWPWWHRRWRRRPGIDYSPGHVHVPSTKDYLSWLSSEIEKQSEQPGL